MANEGVVLKARAALATQGHRERDYRAIDLRRLRRIDGERDAWWVYFERIEPRPCHGGGNELTVVIYDDGSTVIDGI